MAEIFVFGTFWFWALVVLEIAFLTGLIAQRNLGGGFISLVVFVLLIQFLGDVDIFQFVINNPVKTLVLVFSYFAIGTLWASFKWLLLVLDNVRKAKDYREKWLKKAGKKFEDLSHEEEVDFYRKLKNDCPQARIADHKKEFFAWMAFWWISLAITICSDFVTRICKEIYNLIHKWLQGISNKIWTSAGFKIDE